MITKLFAPFKFNNLCLFVISFLLSTILHLSNMNKELFLADVQDEAAKVRFFHKIDMYGSFYLVSIFCSSQSGISTYILYFLLY